MDPNAEANLKRLELTTSQLHFFLNWRHNIILRFAAGEVAVAIVYAQFAEHARFLRGLTLLIGGAGVAVVAWLLDLVNSRHMEAAYVVGARLERDLHMPDGVFNSLEVWSGSGLRQSTVLRCLYLGVAAASAIAALCVWV